MSETETPGVLQQIDERLAALSSAVKHLKKPSTISFVERRDLSAKAAAAIEELQAQRTEMEGAEPAADAELPEPVKTALAGADKVLSRMEGHHPTGFNRRSAAAARNLVGQQRRGSGGMSAQQRSPDRIGGE